MSGPARGEVWWGETVAQGRRPYIVLTRDEAIERLNEVIVVPLTTTVRGLANEGELDVADGLPRACVTSFDNLSTIARGQLVEKITTLEPAMMDEICRALNATVACRDSDSAGQGPRRDPDRPDDAERPASQPRWPPVL